MEKILDKLSLYDFFGYLIPGILVLLSMIIFLMDVFSFKLIIPFNNEFVKTVLFITFSYYIGVITHEISEIIQEYIMKLKWGGLLSERFLNDNNEKYSCDFKIKLKDAILKEYGVDLGSADRKINQEVFNLIYSKTQEMEGKDRIQLFNTLYGMYRNFFAGTFLCLLLYFIKSIVEFNTPNFINDIVIVAILLISCSLLLRRCKRFSDRFADYVYRDFYNYSKNKGGN